MISVQKYLIPCSSVFEKPTLIFYGTEKYMNEFFTSPNYYYRASKKIEPIMSPIKVFQYRYHLQVYLYTKMFLKFYIFYYLYYTSAGINFARTSLK